MRTQHLLRRLFVTPMRRSEFLIGYPAGAFVLVVPESAAIILFATCCGACRCAAACLR
jgi:hypothetical protein